MESFLLFSLQMLALLPPILCLIVIILKLSQNKEFKDFLEGYHSCCLRVILIVNHRKVNVLLFELINCV